MKTVRIIRGGQSHPLILNNGDKYDSVGIIIDETGHKLYTDPLINTDHTTGYAGGILAEGVYYAILGDHKGKYRALNIFKKIDGISLEQIKSRAAFVKNPALRVLPSLVPNANHKGQFIITDVNDHAGGMDVYDLDGNLNSKGWDYSHGCITHFSALYGKWVSFFKPNEIVRYVIERDPMWSFNGVEDTF